MRPGQNKRMRGRNNNNRKGPNPLTRSYESNGPDVKIRGTAHHIGEKYLQLARDAQSSGDPVMAESYLQHAEHYFRLIATAQQAQQQAQFGYQRQPGDQLDADDGDDDDDFASMPDRFASPSERAAVAPPQPAPERQPYGQQGGERYNNGQHYGDRPYGGYDNRQNRGGYGNGQGAPYRNDAERGGQGQHGQAQHGQSQHGQDRQGGQDRYARDDRQPRDFDNRGFRRDRQQRDNVPREGGSPRDYGQPRDNGQPQHAQPRENAPPRELPPRELPRAPAAEEQAGGLPAFITAPVRTPQDAPEPVAAEAPVTAPEAEEPGFHMRPRRRRRSKVDPAASAGSEGGEAAVEAPAATPAAEE